MAKKYCFSCAHLNPEVANFCENCGAKLPVIESATIQAGVNKWKVISAVSIAIIVILASSLFYYSSNYNQLSHDYNRLDNQYITLQDEYNKLNSSFKLVLDANQDLEGRIWYLVDEGITLNLSYHAYHSYILRYTDDMVQFVKDSINLIPPSTLGDDIGLDLAKIYYHWSGSFQQTNNTDSEETIGRVHAWFYRETLPIGQTYLRHADLYIESVKVNTAPLIFKDKRGVCYHFARVLVALFDCYFDMIKKPYSAYCIDITFPSGNGHECVLIKDNKGKVAILDWNLITYNTTTIHGTTPFNFTGTFLKVSFTSIEEAVRLHEQFWKLDLTYTQEYSRDSDGIFHNNDEFYAWAQENG